MNAMAFWHFLNFFRRRDFPSAGSAQGSASLNINVQRCGRPRINTTKFRRSSPWVQHWPLMSGNVWPMQANRGVIECQCVDNYMCMKSPCAGASSIRTLWSEWDVDGPGLEDESRQLPSLVSSICIKYHPWQLDKMPVSENPHAGQKRQTGLPMYNQPIWDLPLCILDSVSMTSRWKSMYKNSIFITRIDIPASNRFYWWIPSVAVVYTASGHQKAGLNRSKIWAKIGLINQTSAHWNVLPKPQPTIRGLGVAWNVMKRTDKCGATNLSSRGESVNTLSV